MSSERIRPGRPDDECWQYVLKVNEKQWKCKYCLRIFGGSITRVKAHLAGITGHQISICRDVVTDNVRHAASEGLDNQPKVRCVSRRRAQPSMHPDRERENGTPESPALVSTEISQGNTVTPSHSAPESPALVSTELSQGNTVSPSHSGTATSFIGQSFQGSAEGSIDYDFLRDINGRSELYTFFDCENFPMTCSSDVPKEDLLNNATSSNAQPQGTDISTNQPPSDAVNQTIPEKRLPSTDSPFKGFEVTNNQTLEASTQTIPTDVEERSRESPSRKKGRVEAIAMLVDERESTHESTGVKMPLKINLAHLQNVQNQLFTNDTSGVSGSRLGVAFKFKEDLGKGPCDPLLNKKCLHEEGALPKVTSHSSNSKAIHDFPFSDFFMPVNGMKEPSFSWWNQSVDMGQYIDKVMTSDMDMASYNNASTSKLASYLEIILMRATSIAGYINQKYEKAMGEVGKLRSEEDSLKQIAKNAEAKCFQLQEEANKANMEYVKLKEDNFELQAKLTRKNIEAQAREKEVIEQAQLTGMTFGFENCLDQVKLQFPQLDESDEKINKFKKVVNGKLVDDEDD